MAELFMQALTVKGYASPKRELIVQKKAHLRVGIVGFDFRNYRSVVSVVQLKEFEVRER